MILRRACDLEAGDVVRLMWGGPEKWWDVESVRLQADDTHTQPEVFITFVGPPERIMLSFCVWDLVQAQPRFRQPDVRGRS